MGSFVIHLIFIGMTNKPRKLIIRISEQQARFLADIVLKEERTRSEITREALNQYLVEKIDKDENKEGGAKPRK